MKRKTIFFVFSFFAFLVAGYAFLKITRQDALWFDKYNINKHTSVYTLPNTLLEISGITYIGDNRIAAEQDESGTIFIYDLSSRAIIETLSYDEVGDYEDIAYIGDGIYYLLKSDGTLTEYNTSTKIVNHYSLSTGAKNNEGLTYDTLTNSLLISTKSKAGKGKSFKDERYIYSFNLQSKTLADEPFFVINIKDIDSYMNGAVSELKFRPSAIAVHPKTQNIYIISAIDRVAAIFDRNGNILEAIKLDEKNFYKTEGMTFTDTNNLLIANEGDLSISPKLVEFQYLDL